jgi:hypothetical protein
MPRRDKAYFSKRFWKNEGRKYAIFKEPPRGSVQQKQDSSKRGHHPRFNNEGISRRLRWRGVKRVGERGGLWVDDDVRSTLGGHLIKLISDRPKSGGPSSPWDRTLLGLHFVGCTTLTQLRLTFENGNSFLILADYFLREILLKFPPLISKVLKPQYVSRC